MVTSDKFNKKHLVFNPVLIHDYLSHSAATYPRKTALICGKDRLTYSELERKTNSLAVSLIKLGLKRQNRVLIFSDNSIEAVIALYGVLKAGGVFVMLNGQLKAAKLNYIINDL